MKKILFCFGTRPEAIKLAPLVKRLSKNFQLKICVTGQHRKMLDQALSLFGIQADYDLMVMKKNQDLFYITTKIISEFKDVLLKEKPDLTVVHGDTTTTMAASLASFYLKIPIAHVEAGLRTNDLYSPFPEELNRSLVSKIAKYHLKKSKLKIKYLNASPESLKTSEKFDIILNMEIVEHVENVNFFIKQSSKFLKKSGIMFIATLNQTLKSYIFAIIGAEYILQWLPVGTHDWNKFVKPETLTNICKKNYLDLKKINGMTFNPILNKWSVSDDKSVNYIMKLKKI